MAAAPQIPPTSWDRFKSPNRVETVIGDVTSPDIEEITRERELMRVARERMDESINASNPQRREMLIDMKFRAGEQWEPSIKAARDAQKRPTLTNNRIPGFLAHVVNNLRQQRPEIKVDPIAAGADEEIAEIRQGLIRHIEDVSRAEVAYDSGFENMSTCGLGYMRVVDVREYRSFDRGLRIQWLPNLFSVYEDPSARMPDWSDGRYKFVVEDVTLAEFRRRFGADKSPASLNEFTALGNNQPQWIIGEKIRIAEYWHLEEQEDELWELPDGTTMFASEYDSESGQPKPEAVQARPEKRTKVMWTLLYGLGVLKEREWPGRYIPIIPIIGNQIEIDGERIIVGMVRYAREAQRMFNYMYSCFVEAVALAPKAPFIAAFDQIAEWEDSWKRANTDPQSVLYYKPIVDGQHPVPPPQRSQAEPPIQAFVEGLRLADNNLKSAFRIFDASLGQKGPQESGIAINSRKVESDLATYDWIDNFSRALQFLGIVLDDLLQYYYNSPGRIIQILQEDLSRKSVTMNQPVDVDGEQKIYDLSKGKFAIRISTGPNYPTRRAEAASSMIEMAKVIPQIAAVAAPQMVRAQDWPEKDLIADQLEKAQPPELRTEKQDQPKEDPEQLKGVIGQMSQQIQLLSKLVTEATDKNNAEERKQEWETLRTQIHEETALAIADLKTGSDEAKFMNDKMFARLDQIFAALEPQTTGQQPKESAPASAAPSAPAQPVPPQGANTPAEVGIGA